MIPKPYLEEKMYLDPGSGSLFLQLLIATLAGFSMLIASRWAKIKHFFKKRNRLDNDDK
ncbi:MAG: hypothetical protein QXM93_09355 [Candidatus Methanomethyliaceae archaeon]